VVPREQTRFGVWVEKNTCDDRFYEDMKAVCRKAYPEPNCPVDRIGLLNCPEWRLEKSSCYSWAYTYYNAVLLDTDRYLLLGDLYENPPYEGYLGACEGCPAIQ